MESPRQTKERIGMHDVRQQENIREVSGSDSERLDSWKQIAAYLGKSERTVRRWQQAEGLPVHRHKHLQKGSVWAYRGELDSWMAGRTEIPMAETSEATESPLPDARSGWPFWALAGSALLLLFLLALRGARQAPPTMTIWDEAPLTSTPGVEYGADFSPDRSRVVYFRGDPTKGVLGLFVQPVDAGAEPKPLLGPEAPSPAYRYSPAWSPDGSRIAYLRRMGVANGHPSGARIDQTWLCFATPEEGKEECPVRLNTGVKLWGHSRHLAWTPDGKWIVAPMTEGANRGIHAISMHGDEKRLLSHESEGGMAPSLSPDGRILVYTKSQGRELSAVDDTLIRQDLSGDLRPIGKPKILHRSRSFTTGIAWTPNSQDLIFCTSSRGFEGPGASILFRLDGARPGGVLRQLRGTESCGTVATSRPDGSGQSLLVYSKGSLGFSRLVRFPLGRSTAGRSTTEEFALSSRGEYGPVYSPSGRTVAFVSNRTGEWELWMARSDGTNLRKLTEHGRIPQGVYLPSWSPDETMLAYSRLVDTVSGPGTSVPSSRIAILRVAGGPPWEVAVPQAWAADPQWLDSEWILYRTDNEIWKVRLDGSSPTLVHRFSRPIRNLMVRSGRIYFVILDGSYSLYRLSGDSPELLAADLWSAAYAVTELYAYFNLRPDTKALFAKPLAGDGPVRQVCVLGAYAANSFAVAPDDSELIAAQQREPQVDLYLVRAFR